MRAVERDARRLRNGEHALIVARALVAACALTIFASIAAPALAVDFDYRPGDLVRAGTLGTLFKVKTYLTNNEPTAQTFRVTKVDRVPVGWTASICIGEFCYRSTVNDVEETVEPGATDTVASWIQTFTNEGSGGAVLTVAPVDAPEEAVSYTLTAVTSGVDVLIVDDDGGAAYDSVCANALPAGKVAGAWSRADAVPDAEDLAKFERVIWLTGEASPSLDGADRAAITGYLAGGGEMLLSGQNIARSLCDPTSAEYSEDACAWLASNFYVAFRADNAGATDLSGVAGEPIGDALAFSIAGGAGNQSSPDGVGATGGGVAVLAYDATTHAAGVRNPANCPTTVFLAFGVEGVAADVARADLIARVLGYFDTASPNPDSCIIIQPPPPGPFAMLAPNRPNPFHPSTQFAIRLAEPDRATLEVFDAAGRLVRTVIDETRPAGESFAAWDGKDDDGEQLPGGVYFARLSANARAETQRVVLIR
ncbi:MAG: FlgD immunoglobulin-like domain containing protein [bacterium]